MRKIFCDRCGVEEQPEKAPVKTGALFMGDEENVLGAVEGAEFDTAGDLSLDLCVPCRQAIAAFAVTAP